MIDIINVMQIISLTSKSLLHVPNLRAARLRDKQDSNHQNEVHIIGYCML